MAFLWTNSPVGGFSCPDELLCLFLSVFLCLSSSNPLFFLLFHSSLFFFFLFFFSRFSSFLFCACCALCSDPGSPKKCRARFGLNQQTDWCGPCRWVPNIHPPTTSPPTRSIAPRSSFLLPSVHQCITSPWWSHSYSNIFSKAELLWR